VFYLRLLYFLVHSLSVYIVYICDFGFCCCALHCTVQLTGGKSYNKRLT